MIAGLYQPFDSDDDYWFQRAYSTAAGLVREPDGDRPDILHSDALLLTPQGVQRLEAARTAANSGSNSPFQYSVDLPLGGRRHRARRERPAGAGRPRGAGPDRRRASGR